MPNNYVNDFSTSTKLYFQDLKNHKPITKEKEIELINLAKNGDITARNKILTANLRFVFDIAKRYKGHGATLDDLISEGNMGLIKAIEKFDVTKNVKFISYAVWWVRQYIQDFLKKTQLRSTVEIIEVRIGNEEDDENCLDNQDDESTKDERDVYSDNPIEIAEGHENDMEILNFLLSKTDDRSKEIIELYYGIGDRDSLSLGEIGNKFRLSKERVRQICKKNFSLFREEILKNNFELSIYS